MELFADGVLRPGAFEGKIVTGTQGLLRVLKACVDAGSPQVLPEHFLMALSGVTEGHLAAKLREQNVTPGDWYSGLAACVPLAEGDVEPPTRLDEWAMSPEARAMLDAAEAMRVTRGVEPVITEPMLLLAGLRHASPAAQRMLRVAGMDLLAWQEELEGALRVREDICPFEADGRLNLEVFSPSGRRVLRTMQAEAEALGYDKADARHLLLGLLSYEGGVTHYALHLQGCTPRRVHEAVSLSLRGRARRTRSQLPLDRAHLQLLLADILTYAGHLAAQDDSSRIAEGHLFRGLLSVDSLALTILNQEKADPVALRRTAQDYRVDADEEEETVEQALALSSVEDVRAFLKSKIVGQDEAIEKVLPYVQRARFGFRTEGRPVGVFLFCGKSGTGKTELARQLAQAVYRSEEELIFLEMGQFNSPHSMNILVGAPQGYVGYGEGQLTNGLRDHPNCVVLFDEIERADRGVDNALFRFIDEGLISDPAGPVRDGSNCIVVLTSNTAGEELGALWGRAAREPDPDAFLRRELREKLMQEGEFNIAFLNRVDEVILFRPLDADAYTEIARREIAKYVDRFREERQIEVEVDQEVAAAIGRYCAVIEEGARATKRLVNSVVVTPVIDHIVSQGLVPPLRVAVGVASVPEPPIGSAGPVVNTDEDDEVAPEVAAALPMPAGRAPQAVVRTLPQRQTQEA